MKILTIVGARPQFIKAATISRAIQRVNHASQTIQEVIVHTGQHYDHNMSDIFFEEMEIPKPAYNLSISEKHHGAMTGKMLEKIETILLSERPDMVLVYGDTNSTLAGSLAASKLHIPVAHIEAGLRSFNMAMPEEINRILTDRISTWLFCPTQTAVTNLHNEGFSKFNCNIINSGDVMYDATLFYTKKAEKNISILDSISHNNFALCTVHRQENTDNPDTLTHLFETFIELNTYIPLVIPLHPRTQEKLSKLTIKGLDTLNIIAPIGYFDMLTLLKHCSLVMTDSGGLQKEAFFFKKPCITLRNETEWTELIQCGVNSLVGSKKDLIMSKAKDYLINTNLNFSAPLYGNGKSAISILNQLLH